MMTKFCFGARLLCVLLAGSLMLFAGMPAPSAAVKYKPKPEERWTSYRDERFGFTIYYPSALFGPGQPSETTDGRTFLSNDGRAKIAVFGALNEENFSPTQFRKVILEKFGGYDQMDYSPIGQTWFVLSGFRGENIYYQKVMFTCGNKVINVFSMTFPTAEKPRYEGMIELMEDYFRPGRGTETPPGC